jgi:hypothetical protein
MAYFQNPEQITHKLEILRLIRETNKAFATFDTTPTLLDQWTQKTSFKEQAHKGKMVALAVLTLYANAKSILPPEFFERTEPKIKYKRAFEKNKQGIYPFLSEDAIQQYEGIINIIDFYQEILDALYSLPDFSDTIQIYQKKNRKRTDLEEEDPFEY